MAELIPTQSPDTQLTAFEAALDEAIALLEQGEEMNKARFEALVAQLSIVPEDAAAEVAQDDPRLIQARRLMARADELERSAQSGHGQMDGVNSLLSPLMGKKAD